MFGVCLLLAILGPLHLDGPSDFIELTPYVQVYEDVSGSANVQTLGNAPFHAVSRLSLNHAGSTYWIRFAARGDARRWLLTSGFRPAHADLFVPNAAGGYDEIDNGDLTPNALRPVRAFNWIVFPMPQTQRPVYLRIRTIEPLVNLVAYTKDRFASDNMRDVVVIVALLSILCSLALSSFMLYFVMRDPLYLYYAAYIVCQTIYRANDFGLWQSMVFAHQPFPYVRTEVIFDGLTLVAATFFIRAFLRSHAHSRTLDRINVVIACIGALYALAALAGVPVRYTLVQNFSFVYVPVWIATGIMAWRRGYLPARLFMLAWSALMVGIVLEAAVDMGFGVRLGIVRESRVDVALDYVVYLGIALESILLSLSLALAYRTAVAEKERAQSASIEHLHELIDIRERTEQMAHLAYSDSLTNLPNRTAFLERMEEALHAARRHGHSCALLYLDLNQFKRINDTLGHLAGDAALIEASGRLRRTIRNDEMAGRLGGDEFAVFVPHLQEDQDLQAVVDRLHEAFEAPLQFAGHLMEVGVSIGKALYPRDGQTREDLIAAADADMYRTKINSVAYSESS